MSNLQQIPVTTINGASTSLSEYLGKVLLVVNVASKCGLTPQYEGLEATYRQYKDQGFEVLGFPANNFGAQEPGTDDEIAEFCSTSYSVSFPLFSKISVAGDDQHPLYGALTAAAPHAEGDPQALRDRLIGYGLQVNEDPDVLWNFEKFLVGRDGNVVTRFAPNTTPDDPALIAAIEGSLAG
ncbi:MAG: glutathione peroxidase [Actinomycetota bacterium]|nr:glutathione peroxidase [Actinomycetota bacterium]